MSNILIIDDQLLMRQMLNDVLVPSGHDISQAGNSSQALTLIASRTFDLIITDIYFRKVDSLILIRQLKQKSKAKIIVITGGDIFLEKNKKALIQKWGVDDLFPKPFNIAELMNRVYELLADVS